MSEEEIKKAIESVQSQTMNTMSFNDSIKLEKYIEQLQQENKELKEKYNKALDILLDYRLPCEDDLLDYKWCGKNCDDNYLKCWNRFIEDKLKELKDNS